MKENMQLTPASSRIPPLFNLYSSPAGEAAMHMHMHMHAGDQRRQHQQQTYSSSRWCPTPEQLRALEEYYKRGIRTPSTFQIQQMTSHLRRLGKIEGKNVFYWFQNHKARERQKMRRRLSMASLLFSPAASTTHHQHQHQHQDPRINARTTDVEAPLNKSCPTYALTHTTPTCFQEAVSIPRADTAEAERDVWIQQQLLLQQEIDIKQTRRGYSSLENNGISPSRHSHVTINSHQLTPNSNSKCGRGDQEQCVWQIDSTKLVSTSCFESRRLKTLELFPLHRDDKAPVQFYEFL